MTRKGISLRKLLGGRRRTIDMAELYVRIVDKIHKDFYINCMASKRGDVISILPDGAQWGTEDLRHTDYRIIKFPGIKPDLLDGFLAEELETDLKNPSKTLQFRGWKFDLDTVALDKQENDIYLKDDKRQGDSITLNYSLDQVLALQIKKQPIQDPHIFGDPGNEF